MKIYNFLENFSRLLKIISKRRRAELVILLLVSLISAISEIINIALIVPYLDFVSRGEMAKNIAIEYLNLEFFNQEKYLMSITLLLLGSVVLSLAFRTFTLFWQYKLGASISSDLGVRILRKYLNMPYFWHLNNNTSILKGYLTKDVDNLSEYINGITKFLVNSIIALSIGSYLILLYPKRTSILLLLLSLVFLIIFIFLKKSLNSDGKIYSRKYQITLKIIDESLASIELIKLYNNFQFFIEKFKSPNREFRDMGARINIKAQSPRIIIESFLLLIIITSALIISITSNSIQKELAFIGTIGLGTYKIMTPMQQIFNGLSSMEAYKISFEKISKFLFINDKFFDIKKIKEVKHKNIFLEFSNVYFKHYSDKQYTLKKINFQVEKGEKIGLIGYSGSGKTTFIKLLLGLFNPTKGSIFNKGKNIFEDQKSLRKWQNEISYVSQDIFLLDDDLRTNISFGIEKNKINDQRIVLVSKISEIDNFIKSLPKKYYDFSGEKGIKLSGGQKQRIAIARALYRLKSILVLDEALSSLDAATENKIINNIFNNFQENTIFLISHRLNSLRKCDKLIILDKGIIQDIGDFSYLEKKSDLFKKLLNSEKYF